MEETLITNRDYLKFKNEFIHKALDLITKDENQSKLLKTGEVQEILRCSLGTIHKLRKDGVLVSIKIGGTYYYPLESLQQLVKTNYQNFGKGNEDE